MVSFLLCITAVRTGKFYPYPLRLFHHRWHSNHTFANDVTSTNMCSIGTNKQINQITVQGNRMHNVWYILCMACQMINLIWGMNHSIDFIHTISLIISASTDSWAFYRNLVHYEVISHFCWRQLNLGMGRTRMLYQDRDQITEGENYDHLPCAPISTITVIFAKSTPRGHTGDSRDMYC